MIVPTALLAKLAAILVSAGIVYSAINGLKDQFPNWTAAHPKSLKAFNAIGSLAAALLVCIGGHQPTADKPILELIPCVLTAAMTFLVASGFHEAKSSADTARASSTVSEFKEAEKK